MHAILPTLLIACMAATACNAQDLFADPCFVPPIASKSLLEAVVNPLPPNTLTNYLRRLDRVHVFDVFAGANDALKAEADNRQPLEVARGYPVQWDADALFGAPFADGGYYVWQAAVTSVDARAVRLCVDLSRLNEDAEVWVVAPALPRAFGPYSSADRVEGGTWLATIGGDTAVLMVRGAGIPACEPERMNPNPQAGMPALRPSIRLEAVSHFYRDLEDAAKVLECNVAIACQKDPTIQKISSGVGMLFRPYNDDMIVGSGTLINAPASSNLEPYFLTAAHVVADRDSAANAEIFWDYRATECQRADAPDISTLLRSRGKNLLAASVTLDESLLELDRVPVGLYGRAYLGWDTREPAMNDSMLSVHHPGGSDMRISYGRVEAVNQRVESIGGAGVVRVYEGETRVGWDRGVTEGGSSGACLLFADGKYRIAGALSNGPIHACGQDPSQNYDYFSSFRRFWTEAASPYLSLEASSDSGYLDPQPLPGCLSSACDMGAKNQPNEPPSGDTPLVVGALTALWLTGRSIPSKKG